MEREMFKGLFYLLAMGFPICNYISARLLICMK